MKYQIKYKTTKYGSTRTKTVNAGNLTKAHQAIYDKYPKAIILDTIRHDASDKNDAVNELARAANKWIIKNRYLFLGIVTTVIISALVFAVSAYFYIQNDYLNSLNELDPENFQSTSTYYIYFILFLVLGAVLLAGGIAASVILQKKKNKQNKI